jgi:signal transduction histidine kinase
MTTNRIRPAALPHTLDRLRLRLTAWYVGTFFTILALLGVGMFNAITIRFDRDLDASLVVATHELMRAVHMREPPERRSRDGIADAVDDLRIPDRSLFLTDSVGRSISPTPVEPWMQQLAREAAARGIADTTLKSGKERTLRVHAERFPLTGGQHLVAIAAADEIELEDRYASLIAAFGAAALASLVLVAAGGWFLARQSTAPVERAIVHMRRFMADAAHELRTPLTVVRSRAEIALQRTRQPADYVQALRGIERESTHLGRIVEDLLMLARADTGERPLERRRVFLDDVTLDAAEAARAIADRKAVRLEVDSFEEAPIVGDPDLLRQLVMILLDNAVKFTAANGLVRVGVQSTGPTASLTVTDTGVGIALDQLSHVFERFYRGDPSRTRGVVPDGGTSEGAGLGLSIAQWIAEEHGATIRLDSQPGQGTTVVVQFPAAGAAENLSSS